MQLLYICTELYIFRDEEHKDTHVYMCVYVCVCNTYHPIALACKELISDTLALKNTSATKKVSLTPNEHATLKPWMRSSNFPCLGTVTVYWDGWEFPSVLTTVNVIVRIIVEGKGSERYINGSNVTDTFLQTGQTNVDLYWPRNV